MVRQTGGRWDVCIKDNAVHLERVSEGDERLFEDVLASGEARELAGLLTRFADKIDKSEKSGDSDDSEGDDSEGDDSEGDDSDNSEDDDSEDDDSDESKDSKDS